MTAPETDDNYDQLAPFTPSNHFLSFCDAVRLGALPALALPVLLDDGEDVGAAILFDDDSAEPVALPLPSDGNGTDDNGTPTSAAEGI